MKCYLYETILYLKQFTELSGVIFVFLQGEADLKPKPLTFGDLRSSMADVALEMVASM